MAPFAEVVIQSRRLPPDVAADRFDLLVVRQAARSVGTTHNYRSAKAMMFGPAATAMYWRRSKT